MNYIVLDLEATCWKNNFGKVNEIIEIGAFKISEDKVIIDEFCSFIKPKVNPELSSFCKELTSIKQVDVDGAPPFVEVINTFIKWIGDEYTLLSWGEYDKKQFIKDCELHKVSHEWVINHVNLKQKHAKIRNIDKPCGMDAALKMEGFTLDGTHHRGIDDARNLTKIFLKYFSIINS
jgi:3'-5' exoribonuclease 1